MKDSQKLIYLDQFEVLDGLSTGEKEILVSKMDFKTKTRHKLIYEIGDTSSQVYFLLKGNIKIISGDDKKEFLKTIVQPGELFGELCLIGEEKRKDIASSMNEEVEYLVLDATTFLSFMKQSYPLNHAVLMLIGERLREVESRLESLLCKDARTRIVEFLHRMAVKYGRKVGFEILVKHNLTHFDIANMTGTCRQVVNMVLNELKRANIIHFSRRRILIRDMEILKTKEFGTKMKAVALPSVA
jgi:CRP-like cAMP-binding protein